MRFPYENFVISGQFEGERTTFYNSSATKNEGVASSFKFDACYNALRRKYT
jgi:hypothetical protein